MIDFCQVLKNPVDGSDMTENVKTPDGRIVSVPFTLSRACGNCPRQWAEAHGYVASRHRFAPAAY